MASIINFDQKFEFELPHYIRLHQLRYLNLPGDLTFVIHVRIRFNVPEYDTNLIFITFQFVTDSQNTWLPAQTEFTPFCIEWHRTTPPSTRASSPESDIRWHQAPEHIDDLIRSPTPPQSSTLFAPPPRPDTPFVQSRLIVPTEELTFQEEEDSPIGSEGYLEEEHAEFLSHIEESNIRREATEEHLRSSRKSTRTTGRISTQRGRDT